MTFQTLHNTDITIITAAFNDAFSDYVIPLKLTEEQLTTKIKGDNIKLELSVGAFENGQLAGFILHGYDVIDGIKTAYNAGTGVIPCKRGQQLTNQLYQFALPLLTQKGISKIVLEVITVNKKAIKIYEDLGFHISRTLNCYKGRIENMETISKLEIKPLTHYDWTWMQSFWDCKPSWQNSNTAIEHLKSNNVSIGTYEDNKLVGYLIFNPKTNRIQQLAVDKNYRNRDIGRQLFSFISTNYSKEISLINVDDNTIAANNFLTHIGSLEKHIQQYEMEKTI